tara:strand:+ start:1068 stop:1778 length:711 start_codon:yes stop_codon:yes gene_type:complete
MFLQNQKIKFNNILVSNKNQLYEEFVTNNLKIEVKKNINIKNNCNFIITGGQTARSLYLYWDENKPWPHSKVNYCLSDERAVKNSSELSNYRMIKKALFKNRENINNLFNVYQKSKMKNISYNFDKYMLQGIDLTLLSLGSDGHFASIFPDTGQIYKPGKIINTFGNETNRYSISSSIVKKSKKIYVLVAGVSKAKALKKIFSSDGNIDKYPAKVLTKSKWLLNFDAANYLNLDNA